MEFEDMQLIWDSQNNERLYAINEDALFKEVQRKSNAISRKLNKIDLIMIGVNLVAGIALLIDSFLDNDAAYEYIVPIAYLAFFGLMIYRRITRRRRSAQFPPTMLGELEKGMWEIDYLIKQSRSMLWWYLLPIYLVISITAVFNGNWWIFILLMAIFFPLTYFGSRWEVGKFYAPKKRELEALKKTLVESNE